MSEYDEAWEEADARYRAVRSQAHGDRRRYEACKAGLKLAEEHIRKLEAERDELRKLLRGVLQWVKAGVGAYRWSASLGAWLCCHCGLMAGSRNAHAKDCNYVAACDKAGVTP